MMHRSPRSSGMPPVARNLQLDRLLSDKSIGALRSWFLFWRPGEKPPHSKARLVVEMRRAMLDPSVVRERYLSLGSDERTLLTSLLRAPGYHWRGTPERLELLRRLSNKGLLVLEEGTTPSRDEVAAAIPCELGKILTAAAGVDVRGFRQLLSLEHFLRSISPERLAAIIEPFARRRPRKPDAGPWARRLSRAEKITSRVQLLEEPLRAVFQGILMKRGGILSCSELFPRRSKRAEATLTRWRDELERSLLGTIGNLAFTGEELVLKGRYVIAFSEILRGFHHGRQGAVRDETRPLGDGEALLDIAVVLRHVLRSPPRTSDGGELFVTARRAMARELRAGESEKRLAKAIAFARAAGLVRQHARRLRAAEDNMVAWCKSDVGAQTRALLRCAAGNDPSHRRLLRAAIRELRAIPVESELEAGSLAALAANRWLTEVLEKRGRGFGLRWRGGRHPFSVDLRSQMARASAWLTDDLAALGVSRVRREAGGEEPLVRLTSFGSDILADRKDFRADGTRKSLVVMPSFEIIVYPQEASFQLLYDLECLAERSSRESAYRYKMTRESLQAGVICGLKPGEILKLLEGNSSTPLPQNVRYSVEDWANQAHVAQTRLVRILETDSKAAMDKVMRLPELQDYMVRRVAPTVAEISRALPERELRSRLDEAGVHLRWSQGRRARPDRI